MKMTLTHKPVVLSAVALITLAACGGGGTDGGGGGGGGGATFSDDIAFGDITSTDSANLIVLSLDASADSNISAVTSETGTLNRQGNTLSFGSVSGTISDDRTSVDLANGLITLEAAAENFAVRFDTSQDGKNTLGIVGVASRTADLPSVSVTYTGDTVITVVSGTDVFDLTGTAAITADFGAATQNVTTELTDLSGTRQPATGDQQVDVFNVGSLTIAGSTVNGSTFSGGTATLDSEEFSLSGAVPTALEGAFYGPAGVEVGGVFVIEDGSTRIFGDFLGN